MANTDNNAPLVERDLKNRVLWLTLNRPERRNPLSLAMIRELHGAFKEAASNPEARVIVLASKGPVFSAGHDLGEMGGDKGANNREEKQREILIACREMMIEMVESPMAIIACIHGMATAGGCQLASSCDLVLASQEATFCTPGVNIGGFCTTPLVAIGRKMRRNHAMELALTGNTFSADDAYRFGLVNRIYPHKDLEKETQDFAEGIAAKSTQAIAKGKKAFYQQIDMPLHEAYEFATEKMIEATNTDDSREGIRAFFEKREPKWTDI